MFLLLRNFVFISVKGQPIDAYVLSHAFTMDVYSHIIEGMQSDTMTLLDEVLPPGKSGVKNKINANLTPTVDITALNN